MKKFKYIGNDIEKKGFIAEEKIVGLNKYYNVSFLGAGITQVDETFIENEPSLWEEII